MPIDREQEPVRALDFYLAFQKTATGGVTELRWGEDAKLWMIRLVVYARRQPHTWQCSVSPFSLRNSLMSPWEMGIYNGQKAMRAMELSLQPQTESAERKA